MPVPADSEPLPPLPAANELQWFAARNAFDLEVKRRLEGYLSPDELPTGGGSVPADVVTSPTVNRIVAVAEGAALPALVDGDLVVRYTAETSGGGGGAGADYYWDWESDTENAAPAGWSQLWQTSGSWTVVSGVSGATGKCLRIQTTTNGRAGFAPASVAADPDRGNVEFLMRHRGVSNQAQQPNGFARGSGASGSETMYRGGFYGPDEDRIFEYFAGTPTSLGAYNLATARANGIWMKTRYRVNGVNMFLKTWLDGDTEPTSWTLTTTDGTITDPGVPGILAMVNAVQYVDWIAIATGGRTAVQP